MEPNINFPAPNSEFLQESRNFYSMAGRSICCLGWTVLGWSQTPFTGFPTTDSISLLLEECYFSGQSIAMAT